MTLGSHQRAVGRSQARLTPRHILAPLGRFDTDPCAADPRPWDCALRNITEAEDSLSLDWRGFGRVWLNPPFDSRVVGGFVTRCAAHDHGTLLVHARTETAWFRPIWEFAAALLFLAGRVVFRNSDGSPCAIENPAAKHFGKPANSGAPVVLAAFGRFDADVLAGCGHDGAFVALRLPRAVLGAFVGSWRAAILAACPSGEIRLADLYVVFAAHPKGRRNRHVREKLRQTLNRGGFQRVGRGIYQRAAADAPEQGKRSEPVANGAEK